MPFVTGPEEHIVSFPRHTLALSTPPGH